MQSAGEAAVQLLLPHLLPAARAGSVSPPEGNGGNAFGEGVQGDGRGRECGSGRLPEDEGRVAAGHGKPDRLGGNGVQADRSYSGDHPGVRGADVASQVRDV